MSHSIQIAICSYDSSDSIKVYWEYSPVPSDWSDSQSTPLYLTVSIETCLAVIESLCQVKVLSKYFLFKILLAGPGKVSKSYQEVDPVKEYCLSNSTAPISVQQKLQQETLKLSNVSEVPDIEK